MNGVNGAAPLWQEARNPEGRVYYYNTQTRATQWTKPEELMTQAERALASQPWKEYTAEGGRKYWYNTETKQSSWEMPEAYKNALGQTASLPAKPVAAPSQFVAGGSVTALQPWQAQDEFMNRITDTPAAKPVFHKSTDPEYNSYEEAETAFMKLLKKSNVQTDWTWEQTMKATIKDPQFRSVKDPRERKAAFEKYVSDLRAQQKDKEKERLAKLRAGFSSMLRSHPEIKYYTRWKTARPILQRETVFRSTDNDDERKQLFEEYIIELKRANVERETTARKSALDELTSILNGLNLEPYTRWAEAQSMIEQNDRYSNDEKFRFLNKTDLLTAFENHIKALERQFNDERQHEKASKARKERRARDAFLSVLQELRKAGKLRAGTSWKDVLPEFENDKRYTNLLGQAGSTPLDLFWDTLEEEERALRSIRNDVYDVLEDRRFEITTETSFSKFQKEMSTDDRTRDLPQDTLRLLYDRLVEKVKRRNEEDKHATERQTRRLIDALRSRIKHLNDPVVRHDSSWESVKARVANTDEYKALETDEIRKQAFDKVVRRLKEKEEDFDRDRSRRDRDRDRDKDGYRGEREKRPKRTSRTPEADAYEADRRKAMADRERSYRKGGSTGLSPPPSRRSADHDRSRASDGRLSYDRDRERDRERRDRDRDRDDDRSYRPRNDRNRVESVVDELDYGGGSGSSRRRRDSEGSAGSRKRVKRDQDREKEEKLKKEAEATKEDIDMASGSEDGELVEEE